MIITANMDINGVVTMTITCDTCKEDYCITTDEHTFHKFTNRTEHIQDIFPDLDVDIRELLISGMCGKCFDKMFLN